MQSCIQVAILQCAAQHNITQRSAAQRSAARRGADPFLDVVCLDEETGRATVLIGTLHHLTNHRSSKKAKYGSVGAFDFTYGCIDSEHMVGIGSTADIQQHGHLLFSVFTNTAGCNREHIEKIFQRHKYISDAANRALYDDKEFETALDWVMADAADEIGDGMCDVHTGATRLMCQAHIERKLNSTGHGKLKNKDLKDQLINDYRYLRRLGVPAFRAYSYERFLHRWKV